MGFLNDQIADDAKDVFMSAEGFSEQITYVKKSGTQRVRVIRGVVVRQTPESQIGTKGDTQPRVTVIVANDSTSGISSDEVDYGGDRLFFPYRIGQSASYHTIKQPRGNEVHDEGCLTLEM